MGAPAEGFPWGIVVSGAGDASYNTGSLADLDLYVYAGESGGHDYYVYHGPSGDRFLYWFPSAAKWVLSAAAGAASPAYLGGAGEWPWDDTWTVGVGAAPAPVVYLWQNLQDLVGGLTITLNTLSVDASGDLLGAFTAGFSPLSADTTATLLIRAVVTGTGGDLSDGPRQWTLDVPVATGEAGGTVRIPALALHAAGIETGNVTLQLYVSGSWEDGNWSASAESNALTAAWTDPYEGPVTEQPTAHIISPANAATVTGTVPVTFEGSVPYGGLHLALSVDGVEVCTRDFASTDAITTYDLDTTGLVNGLHYLTATAQGTNALIGTASETIVVTVSNTGPPVGTDPTATIWTPADSATVDSTVAVDLRGTDDTGLASAEFYIDGALVQSWTPAAGTTWQQDYTWDTLGYANGTHVLSLTVVDGDGNVASDTATVTVANTLALSEGLWVSSLFSTHPVLGPQLADMVTAGRRVKRVLVTAVVTPGTLPETTYGLQFGILTGDGAWTSFADCQTLIPDTIMALSDPDTDARLAIQFTPLVAWQDVSMDPAGVIDAQATSETSLLLLVSGAPSRIYLYTGAGSPAEWLSLAGTWAAGYIPVAFRVLGDKCYIACATDDTDAQPVVLVQDLSNGTPTSADPYAIELASRHPHACTDLEVVGSAVYVGTDDAAGHGHLWRLTDSDVVLYTTIVPGVQALWADGNDVWAGGADGKLYKNAAAADYDTGEDAVTGGLAYNGQQFALTETDGDVYRKVGSTWSLLANCPTITIPAAATIYYGRLWVGGNAGDLYAYNFATGTWQLYTTLVGWTAITQLVAFGGKLLVYGTGGGDLFRTLTITSAHLTGRYVDEPALAIVDTEVAP